MLPPCTRLAFFSSFNFFSKAVTVGLHRVGQTLVLDGNLKEILTPTATAEAHRVPEPPQHDPRRSGSGPAAAPGGGVSGTASSASAQKSVAPLSRRADDKVSTTMIGGGQEEGRWVIVGRGGKHQRLGTEEDEWEQEGKEDGSRGGEAATVTTTTAVASEEESIGGEGGGEKRGKLRAKKKGRGWEENASSDSGRERQIATASVGQGLSARGWSVNQETWPAVGAPAFPENGEAPTGDGILSIVPSRPHGETFGARPPEPAGFWRAFQWELAGMRLMLGSSLQVLLCFVFVSFLHGSVFQVAVANCFRFMGPKVVFCTEICFSFSFLDAVFLFVSCIISLSVALRCPRSDEVASTKISRL